jgi:N-acetylglucosaminyldiphosphoundecaprenol N-acetyl-beta-D-mannosaminyltransferase
VWTNEHITRSGVISEYAEEPVFAPAILPQPPASKPQPLPIALLGLPFDNLTVIQALHQIDQMIASGLPHYVVTANVDFCVQAFHDVELRRILFDAHLVLCDGAPLLWASRLFDNPLPERVAGADLVPKLIERAAREGHRIFFLGGAPEVAREAVARLQSLHPTLNIAGHYSPPYRPLLDMNHAEIIQRIRAARADLLFVSFGCPKAEKWIAMHYRALGVPVTIGVGATIDFLAGRVPRAPLWMRRNGLEWFFRLLQEPRRLWSRYAKDLWQVGPLLVQQLALQRLAGWRQPPGSPTAVTLWEPTWLRVRAAHRLDAASLLRDAPIWEALSRQHCLLDLSEVTFFDSSALAVLIKLHRKLAPSKLVLLAPSATVTRVLRRFHLEEFFCIAPTIIEAREWTAPENAASSAPAPFVNIVPPILWTGEITAANAEEIWTVTRQQLEAVHSAGDERTAIDLSELRFIDSTGIGIMLRAKRHAADLGIRLQFTNARPDVRNVLRMARLEAFLLRP